MDQRFLGLCHRLYNFIKKFLATYAMKSVTLGRGSHQSPAQLPTSGAASAISSSMTDQATHPMAQEPPLEDTSLHAEVEPDPAHNHKNVQEMGDDGISSSPSKEEKIEEEAAVSSIAPEARPPKKMVSINETVEEMPATSNKSKKKKRTEKVGSFDQETDEPKSLKSILKVRSKPDEN